MTMLNKTAGHLRGESVNIDDHELAAAFDQAAHRYDLMVALNPGYHRELAAAANALADNLAASTDGVRLLDLGCGSGASTRALVRAVGAEHRRVEIIGVDASAGMLEQAMSKTWPGGVRFERGFAQRLTAGQEILALDEPVDGVFAAYLFRNLAERDETLTAVHRLLRPGGTLVVQEYSVVESLAAQMVWTLVCWLVIMPLSWLTSRRTELYRYLWRSVCRFDAVQIFTDRLHRAGFSEVEVRPARGWQRGILHTFRARKPEVGNS
jgi:ubiquinone/menaquinone biosynthesis C-methylase UbiE